MEAIAIVLFLIALVEFGFLAFEFYKKVKGGQIDWETVQINIKKFLLYAVTEAEQKLGSGTGKVKLSYVYNMFLNKFPELVTMIPFDTFSVLVDDVLEDFRVTLENSKPLQDFVNKDAE